MEGREGLFKKVTVIYKKNNKQKTTGRRVGRRGVEREEENQRRLAQWLRRIVHGGPVYHKPKLYMLRTEEKGGNRWNLNDGIRRRF